MQRQIRTSEIIDNIAELKVEEDYVQMSTFVQEKVKGNFEDHELFYEFTRETEDILGDSEVILMDIIKVD